MDKLPFVPQTEQKLDILSDLIHVFQSTLCNSQFPENVAKNYKTYTVAPNFKLYKLNGLDVLEIKEENLMVKADIDEVENEVITKHARALIAIDNELANNEPNKLTNTGFYELLSQHALESYGLLHGTHLFSNILEQYLDFTLNDKLNSCFNCQISSKTEPANLTRPTVESVKVVAVKVRVFDIYPRFVVFDNYEINRVYKKKVRLINVSDRMQTFSFENFPKGSPFQIQLRTETRQLAPGISAEFVVTFKPKIYIKLTQKIRFKSCSGLDVILTVTNQRDAPKLTCYVYNWIVMTHVIKQTLSSFLSERQRALNFTIDCGTCLIGNQTIVTFIMKNDGVKGKFFITSEQEWVFDDMDINEKRMECLVQGPFTIMPIFFQIDAGEIAQVIIIFRPDEVGLYTEKIYLVCDNNAFEEIELVGDSIRFNHNYIKVELYYPEQNYISSNQCLNYHIQSNQEIFFVIGVRNDSGIEFEYFWTLKNCNNNNNNSDTNVKNENSEKDEQLGTLVNPKWMKIINFSKKNTSSFTTNDFLVRIKPDPDANGPFYTYLSLYLKNIPKESLWCENEDCDCEIYKEENDSEIDLCHLDADNESERCANNNCDCSSLEDESNKLSLLICKLKLLIKVEPERAEIKEDQILKPTIVNVGEGIIIREVKQVIGFSKMIYYFGLIPKGLTVCKDIVIKNYTPNPIKWKIMEFKCVETLSNCAIFLKPQNLNTFEGTIKRKQKLCYKIEAKVGKHVYLYFDHSVIIESTKIIFMPKLGARPFCVNNGRIYVRPIRPLLI